MDEGAEGYDNFVSAFDVENGSLEGLRPELVFNLGAEWMRWVGKVADDSVKTGRCLAENTARIIRLVEAEGFFCEDRPIFKDGVVSLKWREIWVGDKINKG